MYFEHKIFQSNEKVTFDIFDDTYDDNLFAFFVVAVIDDMFGSFAIDNFDLNVIKCIHTCKQTMQHVFIIRLSLEQPKTERARLKMSAHPPPPHSINHSLTNH